MQAVGALNIAQAGAGYSLPGTSPSGFFVDSVGQLQQVVAGVNTIAVGRKQHTNLQGDFITSNVTLEHPPYSVDAENAAIYVKLDHRPGQTDFIYALYAEIDQDQSIVGGSATKIMHFGEGDAHYVALFHDPSMGNPGGVGYEGAMFADGEVGFLSSFQGNGGFGNSNPVQENCIAYNALVHDNGVDPTLSGFTRHNYGLFRTQNDLGNAFVSQFSEFIPSRGVPAFKAMDHLQRPTFAAMCSGEVHQYGLLADGTNQNRAAPEHRQRSYFWDGSAEQIYDVVLSPGITGAPTPTPQLSIAFQKILNGTPQATEFAGIFSPSGLDLQLKSLINVGDAAIGISSAHPSAALHIESTSQGVLMPRMATAQRDLIPALAGLMIFNTTLNKLQVHDGTAWASLH